MKLAKVVAVVLLAVAAAWAADLTGSWKSVTETPQGSFERMFVLKQDGEKLTGKIVTQRGDQKFEAEIKDGKVKGDEFEFTVEQPGRGGGPARTVPYKGKVSGDTLKGTSSGPQGDREWTATKQK